jgi:hypothetical protein
VTPPLAAQADPGALWAAFSLVPALVMLAGLPLALLAAARAGGAPAKALGALRASPLASAIVGLLAGLGVILLASAAQGLPALGLPLLLVAAAVAAAAFVGLVAEARRLGGELRGRAPGEDPEGGSVALGWLVLAGLPILPVAGPPVWLYLALRGAGASLVALIRR